MSDHPSTRYLRRLERALYETLQIHPRLTLNGVLTIMEVAKSEKPIGYHDLADRLGFDYQKVSLQAAIMSAGRGGRAGRNLLDRVPGPQRPKKLIRVTQEGRQVCDLFSSVDPDGTAPTKANAPVLARLNEEFDGVSLAAPFVFLRVGLNDQIIRDCRLSAESIFQNRPLNNLSRSLRLLRDAGLVERMELPEDERTKPPVLTGNGREFLSDLHALAPRPLRVALDREDADPQDTEVEPEPY